MNGTKALSTGSFWSADLGSWRAAFASLLPLWAVALLVSMEGFPQSPLWDQAMIPLLGLAILLAIALPILLLIKGWMTFDLALYNLIPFVFLFRFDEISTAYKTPFILGLTAILSLGIIGYQRSLYYDKIKLGWVILLAAAVLTLLLMRNSAANFWQMLSDLNYGNCFPGFTGCPPLPPGALPWWRLLFGI